MNERSLPRRLATAVVDTLKSQGHILVVKGGATALTRELDELMTPRLVQIAPKLGPRSLVGEPTSTFGDEATDEAVEEMVADVTRALMDSDHVEDVFAEDNVIRRDVFRAVRDELAQVGEADTQDDEGLAVRVPLDTLGYVAKAVSQRADEATLRDALGRAAEVADAELVGYDGRTREATFAIGDDVQDARLELEEAVAEELADLVETGLVELPTIERRVEIGRALGPAEAKAARPKLDRIGQKTLLSTGCAASWELDGNAAIKVAFTPLSDSDARNVDRLVATFAAMAREALEPKSEPVEEPEAPAAKPRAKSVRAPSSKTPSTEVSSSKSPASVKPASAKPASTKTSAKAAGAKAASLTPASKRAGAAPAEKAAAKKKAPAKKR